LSIWASRVAEANRALNVAMAPVPVGFWPNMTTVPTINSTIAAIAILLRRILELMGIPPDTKRRRMPPLRQV
jgi:hypothetical protein